jgi:hypothetical protein
MLNCRRTARHKVWLPAIRRFHVKHGRAHAEAVIKATVAVHLGPPSDGEQIGRSFLGEIRP